MTLSPTTLSPMTLIAMAEQRERTGDWVYCVCAHADEQGLNAALQGASGVDGEDLRGVGAAGLTAVVGSVDLARFGSEGLRRSLNDLDRLEAIARAHHGVVQRMAEHRSVAPTRLATVYDDDSGVREMLRQHREPLTAALARVDGRQEWGVKAYAQRAQPSTTSPQAQQGESASSGTAYLRNRQAALSTRETSKRTAMAGAEALHATLSEAVVAATRHRPQDPKLSGDDRWMILNASYLLDSGAAEAFTSRVAGAAHAHPELAVALTGPWPPYSFAVIDDQSDVRDAGTPARNGS
jgi:hypothetical protein